MNIYTSGTFDLLNVGHLALLEYCKKLNGILIVGVASDKISNLFNSNMPIIPLEQRIKMLNALECVDKVEPYYNLDYISTCKKFEIDTFVVGKNWKNRIHNLEVEKYLKNEGKRFIRADCFMFNTSVKIKREVVCQFNSRSKAPQEIPNISIFRNRITLN